MNKQSRPYSLYIIAAAVLAFFGSRGKAADLYFDQNGSTAGFGMTTTGSPYDWDTTTPVWNDLASGGAGTFSSWSDGNSAFFASTITTSAGPYTVNLLQDVQVTGLTYDNIGSGAGTGATSSMTLTAASSRTITLASGAQVFSGVGSGVNRALIFGDNINISGDLTIGASTGMVNFAGSSGFSAYSGTVTINAGAGAGGLQIGSNTRFGTGTSLVLNSGTVHLTNIGSATIGSLSGTGGVIQRIVAGGGRLIIDQSTDTNWAGQLSTGGSADFNFEKAGSGTLTLDGTGTHAISQTLEVSGGSLYIEGDLTSTAGSILVGASGNFGGDMASSKAATLSAATSQLSPGMDDAIGTLTLANASALTANNGGILNIDIDGLSSDLLSMTGGLTLGAPMTVSFFELGSGIQAGTAYTFLTLAGGGLNAGDWNIMDPAGWNGSLAVTGGGTALEVTFTVVPEPGVSRFLLGVAVGLIFFRKRSVAFADRCLGVRS